MSRLPTPGGDNGTWGDILNDFLSQEHNPDGSLKKASDIADAKAKAEAAIPASQLGAANGVAQLDTNSTLKASQIPSTVITKSANSGDAGKAIDAYTGVPFPVSSASVLNIKDAPYNAKGDWQTNQVADASISASSNQLTVASHTFVSADVGKKVRVKGAGAGGALLWATITGVTAGKAVLNTAASTTVSGKWAAWGSDDTSAINQALADAATEGSHFRKVLVPQGWYGFDQIVVPSGVQLVGEGWGNQFGVFYGVKSGDVAGTLLMQNEGTGKHGIVFTEEYHPTGADYGYIGPALLDNFTLEGPMTGDSGQTCSGIYAGTASGGLSAPQDGFMLDRLHVIGFPGSGFSFPHGAVPLYMDRCRAFYNRDYGFDFDAPGGTIAQMLHLQNFSGDGNGLGLAHFKRIQNPNNDGFVMLTGVKSEANSLAQQNGPANSHEWTQVGSQRDAVIIEDCSNHFLINGLDHISAEKDLVTDPTGNTYFAPGATIVIKSTGTYQPSIEFACTTRLLSAGNTNAAGCVTIRDEYNGVSVPKEIKQGFYTGKNISNFGGDRSVIAGPFARRLLTSHGDYVAPQNGFEAPGDQVQGPTPSRSWFETDGPSGSKFWGLVLSGGQLSLRAWDDTGANANLLLRGDNASGIPRLKLVDSASGRIGVFGNTEIAQPIAVPTAASLARALGKTNGLGWVDDSLSTPLTYQETVERHSVAGQGSSTVSGRLWLSYFQAEVALAAAHVRIATGTTGAVATGTGALIRAALFSVANDGTLTYLATTANDINAMATAGAEVSEALSSTVTLTPGAWYAYGLLIVSTALPNMVACILGSAAQGAGGNGRPRLAGYVTGLSDLGAVGSTIAPGSILNTGTQPYACFTT